MHKCKRAVGKTVNVCLSVHVSYYSVAEFA